jgi:hypothetical protein
MIIGVKESSFLNKGFTVLNIAVIAFIFVSGLFKADINNWKLDPKVSLIHLCQRKKQKSDLSS